ncbi:hypothetical protein WKI71_45315 [Streptomyces sp. MS1.AVA.1]|uniref:Uncharacterized protein n=1 Tax=Streptomyces machairae TaxID=3134109 RepID=A0ABU8UVS1_9ACTN
MPQPEPARAPAHTFSRTVRRRTRWMRWKTTAVSIGAHGFPSMLTCRRHRFQAGGGSQQGRLA